MTNCSIQKSAGHIAFAYGGTVEYFERSGEVYRAPMDNVLDVDGYRHGRWECSRGRWDRMPAEFFGVDNDETT
jgi:hypothetical protein